MTEGAQPVVIVTGGTSGIGAGISDLLAERGWSVVALGAALASDRNPPTHLSVQCVQADVSLASDVARVFSEVLARYGRLDALVNNAAIGPLGTILDTDEATWDRVIDVNLKGVFLCCKTVLPHLIARGGGSIVNVGSGSAWGKPRMAAYSASKGGLMALSQAMAYDHFHDRIRVNMVIPGGGGIATGMSLARVGGNPARLGPNAPGTAAGRRATPEDIAKAVAFLLSPEAEVISGTVIDVGCFMHQGGPIPHAPAPARS